VVSQTQGSKGQYSPDYHLQHGTSRETRQSRTSYSWSMEWQRPSKKALSLSPKDREFRKESTWSTEQGRTYLSLCPQKTSGTGAKQDWASHLASGRDILTAISRTPTNGGVTTKGRRLSLSRTSALSVSEPRRSRPGATTILSAVRQKDQRSRSDLRGS